MKFRSLICAAILLLVVPTVSSRAATIACLSPYEAMVDLRLPRMSLPVVWDAQYAPRGQSVEFIAAAGLADGTVMAMGRTAGLDPKQMPSLAFVQLDRRGRAVVSAAAPLKAGETPLAMIASGKNFLALSNAGGAARLAWYGADGHLLREISIATPRSDDVATAIVPDTGGGFAVALNSTERKPGAPARGMILRFDASGAKKWQRLYTPGVANEIDGLTALAHGYIATGALKLDDGRMAGWAMRLADNGTVIWEQTFPRGRAARLNRAAPLPTMPDGAQSVVLAGVVSPSDSGPDALWFVALDNGGDVLWQRYVRHASFALAPVGLRTAAAGGVFAVANAHVVSGAGNRDHIRLMSLSSHGALARDDAYIEGVGARAGDFSLLADGSRLIAATIDADDQPLGIELQNGSFTATGGKPASAAGKPAKVTHKGWLIDAPPAPAYDDPCAAK